MLPSSSHTCSGLQPLSADWRLKLRSMELPWKLKYHLRHMLMWHATWILPSKCVQTHAHTYIHTAPSGFPSVGWPPLPLPSDSPCLLFSPGGSCHPLLGGPPRLHCCPCHPCCNHEGLPSSGGSNQWTPPVRSEGSRSRIPVSLFTEVCLYFLFLYLCVCTVIELFIFLWWPTGQIPTPSFLSWMLVLKVDNPLSEKLHTCSQLQIPSKIAVRLQWDYCL